MPLYPVKTIIDGQPCFEKPLDVILIDLKEGGALNLLTPLEAITARQRRWYKGKCLPFLAKHDENQETEGWWDDEVKRKCRGLELLKQEIFYQLLEDGRKIPIGRLTTKGVGARKMKTFIREILSVSLTENWGIAPPDKDLRKK